MIRTRLVEWEAVPNEPEYDLTPFIVAKGSPMPVWFWNALVRGDVLIEPEPKKGDYDWGREVRVIKTGHLFHLGATMWKGDLNFPPI